MKSNLILAILGILLCTAAPAATSSIKLTENNHAILSGPVTDKSVAGVQVELGKIAAKNPAGSIVYLVLDTPGGSVFAGNQLADFGKSLPVLIKPICLFCASIGYHLFQSFDERLVQPSSILMSHRVTLNGIGGQIPGELVTRIKFYTDISDEMDRVVSKRVGMTFDAYRAAIYDELWLTGQQALAAGHADKMVKVHCSGELLKGKRTEQINTIFGSVTVTFSKCPLIQGILDFKFDNVVIQPRNNSEVMSAIRKHKTTIRGWF